MRRGGQTYQLRHTLLRLRLRLYIDPKRRQMRRQLRVLLRIVARITIYIRPALRRDRPKLHAHRVPRRLEMRQPVPIAPEAAELLPPAAQRATGEAEPQVLAQVARRAVREAGLGDWARGGLGQHEGVLAREDLFLPGLDFGLARGRHGLHDAVDEGLYLELGWVEDVAIEGKGEVPR